MQILGFVSDVNKYHAILVNAQARMEPLNRTLYFKVSYKAQRCNTSLCLTWVIGTAIWAVCRANLLLSWMSYAHTPFTLYLHGLPSLPPLNMGYL